MSTTCLAVAALTASMPSRAELTANASVTNNYIWRGLTQTTNESAVQGGVDYAHENGFYAGTWVSNVSYFSDDEFSYENDLYLGYAGEAEGFSYDLGYLYYNYDSNGGFDFSEIYGTLGFGNLGLSLFLLAHTEADEAPGQDFGFGQTYYASVDYAVPLQSGTEIGFHAGYHAGDFSEAFNGVGDDYFDYNVSISRGGFSFMVTGTNLGHDDDNDGFEDFSSQPARDNDNIKFVASYSVEFEL